MTNPKPDVIELGTRVWCDACDKEYTNSDASGGLLFGSYAYCPECAPEIDRRATQCGERDFIKARCPEGMSFRDWCIQLRGGDNTIKVYNAPDVADRIRKGRAL